MDNCHTCGGEIAGGADHALVLPSPFSSFHVAHHMSCYMADAISREREACWKAVNDLIKHGELAEPYHSQRNGLVLASNAIRARGGK